MNTGPKKAKELLEILQTPFKCFRGHCKNAKYGRKKITDGPLKDINGIGIKYVIENKSYY
jgi:hypothetical protein